MGDLDWVRLVLFGCGCGVGQRWGPSVASGVRVPVLVGAGGAWSGRVREGSQAGEDFGE